MKLRELAHSRAGDKGSLVTISLIAYREEDFALLAEQVTAERVAALFGPLLAGPMLGDPVERYAVPGLGALNFVLHRPATESVTRSLALDAHGKTLSYMLLGMEIDAKQRADG